MLKTFEILLDIEKNLYSPANILFTASRNDFNSVELQFSLVQDDAAFDLTGSTVEIAIKKPSGLVIYQDVEIVDAVGGKAAAQLTIQAYSEFGLHVAEIYIRNEAQMIVTSPFYYFSRESVIDGNIESINDWSALQKVLFSTDKKPILTDGVPDVIPEYIGQMAFDTTGRRAFIAFDTIAAGWQLMAASEGAGGIVSWADIIGKPASYPAAAHGHAIAEITGLQPALDSKANDADYDAVALAVDGLQYDIETKADAQHRHDWTEIDGKPAAYPAELHNHEIADVNGLQNSLDSKTGFADLTSYALAEHAHAWDEIQNKPVAFPAAAHGHPIAEIDGLQLALDAKADAGAVGTPEAHNHEIADVNGLQAALDSKADDADLLTKADVDHSHDFASITGKPLTYPPEAHEHPEYMTQAETDARYALRDAEGGTIQSVEWGTITGSIALQTDLQAALDGKADNADLIPYIAESDADVKYALKSDLPVEHGHAISHIEGLQTEIDAINAEIDTKADINHNHEILDITGLQAALDGKADDSDLLTKADADHSHDFAAITGKPLAYPPEAHNHDIVNITGLQVALDGKADDADMDGKADIIHRHDWAEIDGKPAVYPAEAHDHAIADVNGLQIALDGKADDADLLGKADVIHTHDFASITGKPASYPAETHGHAIADVDGLQASLDGKADDVHAHAIADVTGLQAALDGKADDADLNNLQTRAVVSGAVPALPTITPAYSGQFVIDSANKRTFIAAGTTADDWKRLAETTYADSGDNHIKDTILNGNSIWTGTQAAYDNLTKDPKTLYFITG